MTEQARMLIMLEVFEKALVKSSVFYSNFL
jgi:hypothetical protein